MRSLRNLPAYPAGRLLPADEIIELHAARILLLVFSCGSKGRLTGLTKLAKLDFFVRYPGFFARACAELGVEVFDQPPNSEAPMVRHFYGPWDHNYYHIIAYLRSRGLLRVGVAGGRAFEFVVTRQGREAVTALLATGQFADLQRAMVSVDSVLSKRTGTQLRRLIYQLFEREVRALGLGQTISH